MGGLYVKPFIMKQSLFILCILFLFISCKKETQKESTPEKDFSIVRDSLTDALQKANKEGELVGFSVAIIDQDRVLYNEGFGYADSKNNTPCLLYTSPSPRDQRGSRMPSSA